MAVRFMCLRSVTRSRSMAVRFTVRKFARKPVHPLKGMMPIKRSSNEFGVFVKERFNDPELEGKAPVKIKKLAQQWRTMSDASKQVYIDRHRKNMTEHKAALEKFWSSISKEQAEIYREEIKDYVQKKREYIRKRALRADAEPLPPRRLSGYALFVKESYPMINKDLHRMERISVLARRWNNLSDQEKELFNLRAIRGWTNSGDENHENEDAEDENENEDRDVDEDEDENEDVYNK